jgi:hypothetical protein
MNIIIPDPLQQKKSFMKQMSILRKQYNDKNDVEEWRLYRVIIVLKHESYFVSLK